MLIVRRPQSKGRGIALQPFQILVNGKPAASIMAGTTVTMELPPGRCRVQARYAFLGSQAIEFDADREGTHSLAVNLERRLSRLYWLVALLIPLIHIGFNLLMVAARPGSADDNFSLVLFLLPLTFLPIALFPVILGNSCLALAELPNTDLTDRETAEFLEAQPIRVRVTIVQIMIAVALVAILLGTGIEVSRYQRSGRFRSKATAHASMEEAFRETERKQIETAVGLEKVGLDGGFIRKNAARTSAKADYHAAMKRKYEEAAARRMFFVEPDPPEPPWP